MLTDEEIDEVVDWQLQKTAENCFGPMFELKMDFVYDDNGEAVWYWNEPASWPYDKMNRLDNY